VSCNLEPAACRLHSPAGSSLDLTIFQWKSNIRGPQLGSKLIEEVTASSQSGSPARCVARKTSPSVTQRALVPNHRARRCARGNLELRTTVQWHTKKIGSNAVSAPIANDRPRKTKWAKEDPTTQLPATQIRLNFSACCGYSHFVPLTMGRFFLEVHHLFKYVCPITDTYRCFFALRQRNFPFTASHRLPQ